MAAMEFHPILMEEEHNVENYIKIPLSRISSVGVAFEPLAAAVQNLFGGGTGKSGLYRITVPNGMHLSKRKDGSGFIGSTLSDVNNQGFNQATLNPLVCNPTLIFMATALTSIDKKLDSILETQQEILGFLVQKEKSELKGDLKFLVDILSSYKFNWDNEKYKTGNFIKVLDIRQEAERKIDFYREQIIAHTRKKTPVHSNQIVQKQLDRIEKEFANYQLALYIHAFSYFLEVMLQENFDAEYLSNITQKIENNSIQYRELYTKCFDQMEEYLNSSVESHLLRGLSSVSSLTGKAIEKAPLISKSQIDETLIGAGKKLKEFSKKKTVITMQRFVSKQSSYIRPFIDNIQIVNKLYNQPINMIFDAENLYFGVVK